MLSSILKSKINKLWDKFWSRGLANPISSIEQISYLLFMRRLDEVDQEMIKDSQEKKYEYKSLFIEELRDTELDPYFEEREEYRWSNFTQLLKPVNDKQEYEKNKLEMFELVRDKVFPFIKQLNDTNQKYTKHMSNAQFLINSPNLLADAVEAIEEIYQEIKKQQEEGQQFQDTQGDVYEYLLSETGRGGKNGQFRTPRHLIQFMCEILDPNADDIICDPACGTGGFLVGAFQHILTKNTSEDNKTIDENGFQRFTKGGGEKIKSEKWENLKKRNFYGFDLDQNMVRIGMMNMMLHGITHPDIENIDTLSKDYNTVNDGKFSIILANPPFTGRIDKDNMSKDLRVPGTQTELLFLDRISRMLNKGGKAAVIIPEGVLFGRSNSQQETRKILLRDNILEAVISLPSGAFKPYTGVKTAILVFKKVKDDSKSWNTQKVWFYELLSDGYSLDDQRRKLKQNPLPIASDHYINRKNNILPNRKKYFFVPLNEIEKNKFDLSYNRYKEFEYTEQNYDPPKEILSKLIELEKEILKDMNELNDLIG